MHPKAVLSRDQAIQQEGVSVRPSARRSVRPFVRPPVRHGRVSDVVPCQISLNENYNKLLGQFLRLHLKTKWKIFFRDTLFFYKNRVYKNIRLRFLKNLRTYQKHAQPQIWEKIKNITLGFGKN